MPFLLVSVWEMWCRNSGQIHLSQIQLGYLLSILVSTPDLLNQALWDRVGNLYF